MTNEATTSTAHTAGPWQVTNIEHGSWQIHLEDLSPLATVGDGTHEGDPETAEANARLIAAAPEMFEILQEYSNACYDRIAILREEMEELGLTEEDEDAADLMDQMGHWEAAKRGVDVLIARAEGR